MLGRERHLGAPAVVGADEYLAAWTCACAEAGSGTIGAGTVGPGVALPVGEPVEPIRGLAVALAVPMAKGGGGPTPGRPRRARHPDPEARGLLLVGGDEPRDEEGLDLFEGEERGAEGVPGWVLCCCRLSGTRNKEGRKGIKKKGGGKRKEGGGGNTPGTFAAKRDVDGERPPL